MRRDRFGDPIDNEPHDDTLAAADTPHDPRCRDGWLGEDEAGRVIPCLTCRPHLHDHREALRRQLEGAGQ